MALFSSLSIEGRTTRIECVEGVADINLRRASIRDEVSSIYVISADVFSNDRSLTEGDLLGKRFKVSVQVGRGDRVFWGTCVSASHMASELRRNTFSLKICPWLWGLTQNVDSRIFQKQTCIEVARAVCGHHAARLEDRTTKDFNKIEYLVQYAETDYAFLKRLLETNGVYFFFKQTAEGEVLVLCDALGLHSPLPNHPEIEFFHPDASFRRDQEHVYQIDASMHVVPTEVTKNDTDFTKIRPQLSVNRRIADVRGFSERRAIYEPADPYVDIEQGEARVRMTAEALAAGHHLVTGSCNVRDMAVGGTFKLKGHEKKEFNREYLVLSAHFSLVGEHDFGGGQGDGDEFACHFEAMPTVRPYRPRRLTPRPHIASIQTAVVVGPAGEEIYTDKFGRVKVQFYWDRLGKRDENSSCWVRVATPWAGRKWGALAIPRIGQEVVVQFEDGNPDRPIITGMLYNAENMPPYELPGAASQSGLRSNSTKGGGGANEIQMEDRKDAEQFNVTAERDYMLTVKNDATVHVGYEKGASGSYVFNVHQDRIESVSNGDYYLGVDTGNRSAFIKTNDTVQVEGDRSEIITGTLGSEAKHITMNGKTDFKVESPDVDINGKTKTKIGSAAIEVDGKTIKLTGAMEISLSVGGSSIVLNAGGVTIVGPLVKIN